MKRFLIIPLLCIAFLACKKEAQQCPKNYTGQNCEEEVTPNRIRVSRIQMTNYPGTNSGAQWDINSQWADPYFQILNGNNEVIFQSEYLNEKQPASICQWDVDLVMQPDQTYFIVFYDEDGATDEMIDSAVFTEYNKGAGFPEYNIFNGVHGSQITAWVRYEY